MGVRSARSGEWLIECMICAKIIYASTRRKTYDGLIVCDTCFDPKHPQLKIKKVRDDTSVPESHPRIYPTDTEFDPYTQPGNIGAQGDGGL